MAELLSEGRVSWKYVRMSLQYIRFILKIIKNFISPQEMSYEHFPILGTGKRRELRVFVCTNLSKKM